MKCDELKRKYSDITGPYYGCNEVDEAIDELKKKLMPCLNGDCILTCEVVEKYGKENAELKAEIESLKASHYAESVDAGMENRKLKRALWLTRALRARDIQRWWIAVTCSKTTDRACSVWNNVERKCRAKAEQYK